MFYVRFMLFLGTACNFIGGFFVKLGGEYLQKGMLAAGEEPKPLPWEKEE